MCSPRKSCPLQRSEVRGVAGREITDPYLTSALHFPSPCGRLESVVCKRPKEATTLNPLENCAFAPITAKLKQSSIDFQRRSWSCDESCEPRLRLGAGVGLFHPGAERKSTDSQRNARMLECKVAFIPILVCWFQSDGNRPVCNGLFISEFDDRNEEAHALLMNHRLMMFQFAVCG